MPRKKKPDPTPPAATASQISVADYLGPDLRDSIVAPDGTVPPVPTEGTPGWVNGASATEGEKSKPGRGRPSDFDPKFIPQAIKLAQLGATDLEVADFFEVTVRTLYRWKVAHPDFGQALKLGKDAADDRVVESLFRRATGYSFPAVKVAVDAKTGMTARASYTEHVPPDVTACIFWLKNRRREDWRDKHEIEHTGEGLAELIAMSGMEVPGVKVPGKSN